MKSTDLAKPDDSKVGTIPGSFSLLELAEITGLTKGAIRKKANKEKWLFEQVSANGGRQKRFAFEFLPAEVRRQVLIHYGQIPADLAAQVASGDSTALFLICGEDRDVELVRTAQTRDKRRAEDPRRP